MFFALLACAGTVAIEEAELEIPASAEGLGEEPTLRTQSLEDGRVEITEGSVTLTLTPHLHASTLLEFGEVSVWLDPWSKRAFGDVSPADYVLITDIHADHMDPAGLAAVSGPDTRVFGPQAVADALAPTEIVVLANGETTALLDPLTLSAVPMYNHTRGPEPGKLYHDKGRGNGYLLSQGGLVLYIAGDTACTDEMKALENVDVALIPMNLPYTMTPEEAAECVAAFKPTVAIPYHYRDSDPGVFAAALEGSGVQVLRVEYYPE